MKLKSAEFDGRTNVINIQTGSNVARKKCGVIMVYPIAHHPDSLYAIDWEEGYQKKNHASSLHPWFSIAPPVALPKPRAFTNYNYSKTGTALLSTSFGRHIRFTN